MKKHTLSSKLIAQIHSLLNNCGLMEQKKTLVASFTEGRTSSTKEMTYSEAIHLIKYLQQIDPMHLMRRKIISLFYQLGWIHKDTPEDVKINIGWINNWLMNRGVHKKPLQSLSKKELVDTLNQIGAIVKKDENKHSKTVQTLLDELNIDIK